MTRLLLFLVLLIPTLALAKSPRLDKYFSGQDGCFVLKDIKKDTILARYNEKRCRQRITPCSTFKVALALMAFDKDVLADENTLFKWDGRNHGRPEWNQDQTARTWMERSVVWYSQRLTPQLGMATIGQYLAAFSYGNQDFSGGLTNAWLGSSLKISADEQIAFLERWWKNELPVSARAVALTKTITFLRDSPHGFRLHGKTGSGPSRAGAGTLDPDRQIGWFVGHVGKDAKEYVFALNFTDRDLPASHQPGGLRARDTAEKILQAMGLW